MTHGEEYNIYCNIKQFKSILFQLKLLEVSSRKKKKEVFIAQDLEWDHWDAK